MQTSLLDQNTSMFNSWRESPLLIIHQQPYGLYAGMGRHDPVGFSFLPGGQLFTIPDMAICLAGSSENLDQGPQRTAPPPWTAPAKTQLNLKAAILLALRCQLVLWTVWGLGFVTRWWDHRECYLRFQSFVRFHAFNNIIDTHTHALPQCLQDKSWCFCCLHGPPAFGANQPLVSIFTVVPCFISCSYCALFLTVNLISHIPRFNYIKWKEVAISSRSNYEAPISLLVSEAATAQSHLILLECLMW